MIQSAPGMFFVFEGPNGSGKSTAIKSVAERMRQLGADVVLTREPGGSPTAEQMRRLLLDPEVSMDPHEQTLLFMAARRNHLRTVIVPAMERGAIVLCDRFVASTLVYQTLRPEGGPPVSMQQVFSAHQEWCWGIAPDMQFHLHLPVEVAALRRNGRTAAPDRYESDDLDYERACARRYSQSGEVLGFRQHDVDAAKTPSEIVDSIMSVLDRAAQDKLWSVMQHRLVEDRRGRWFPHLDDHGRAWWTHDPSEAHRYAADIVRRENGAMITFVRRSAAVRGMQNGLRTDELEIARP